LHLPSRTETLRSADHMDKFCSEVDMQIGLNIIRPDGARLASGRVRQLAESMGCVLDRDGRFRKEGPGGSELYSIANLDPAPFSPDPGQSSTTSGVTVVLDVPRAPPTEEVFAGFRDVSMALAKSLDARLVDDNRQPISAAALQSIVTEIAKSRERMRTEGIVPGGPLAQRLFF
jgi:FtsZ-interacting cell division protein ZipA